MAEALYRKYRPQTFDDVVGQTHIERTLKNAIESDKVSHAYLFCGPRGTGKTTTARLLAKALLCENGPTPSPDGTCEECHAIADGTHPDVSELDAASRTGVENVREEIIGRVQYAPTRGRYKIYIIDEVHMLSTAAFNALLKTLEEPPDHVVFVLCTTDPQRVPDTIHSRCQRFDFHRLSNEEIVSRLGAVCMAEGIEFEGDALDLVAHRAQGGMRDALTTLEQLIAFGGGKVTVEVAQGVLGSVDTDDMSTVAKAIAARDAAACFTWLSNYVETGADLARFARDLAAYVRDLYVLALTDGALTIDAAQAARPAMAKEAELFGVDRLAYILGVLGDLGAELRSSINPRLSFEIALTRMVRPESDLTLEALAARVAALEAAMAQGVPAAPAPAAAASPADSPSVSRDGAGASFVAPSFSAPVAPAARVDASVPPVSSGYGRAAVSAAGQRDASTPPSAAQDRSAAFRAELERRKSARTQAAGGQTPVAAPAASSIPARPTSDSVVSPAPAAGSVSAALKEKLGDPSALQRGWQAALAELKRQRAAYGALLLSARAIAQEESNGLVIEFSRENTFAFAAAQKPDISAAIASALQHAFGAPVPFSITQGDGASSPAKTAMARAAALRSAVPAPMQAPSTAPAPAIDGAPAYSDDDVVPYDDADVASYAADSYAPWDEIPPARASSTALRPDASAAPAVPATAPAQPPARHENPAQNAVPVVHPTAASSNLLPAAAAGHAPAGPSHEGGGALESEDSDEPSSGASGSVVLSVDGPDPVDPYAVGKKLGFDSMPSPKRRLKGMIKPVGWPGIGDAGKTAAARPDSSSKSSASQGGDAPIPSVAEGESAVQEDVRADASVAACEQAARPSSDEVLSGHSDGPWMQSNDFDRSDSMPSSDAPVRPNPFASRAMPAGIGNADASAPVVANPVGADSEIMDAADIFESFGVSFDKVQEER
ncbi:MAG: DNA polymerase III subunit gamma/tau [Slackia sp.]|nr:DNA polymerase III subunit gamma/tau [Slackia sp.]